MLYDCKFLLLLLFLVFPGGSDSKESTCNTGDLGSIPGLGRSPGEGKGYPLQYSWLEKPLGHRSLVDYSSWGHKQSDTTEWLSTHTVLFFSWLCARHYAWYWQKIILAPGSSVTQDRHISVQCKAVLCGLCTYKILWKEAPRRKQGQPLWGAHS